MIQKNTPYNKNNCPFCGGTVHPLNYTKTFDKSDLCANWKCSSCRADFTMELDGRTLHRTVEIETKKPTIELLGQKVHKW